MKYESQHAINDQVIYNLSTPATVKAIKFTEYKVLYDLEIQFKGHKTVISNVISNLVNKSKLTGLR